VTTTLEREIKLRFDTPAQARAEIMAAGATPLRGRRLQEDCLLDLPDEKLRRGQCALRIRIEAGKSRITFKGPPHPSAMKVREELETVVGDGDMLLRILERLGYRVWFRYQKFREEFSLGDLIVAIDETPVGTYVEIEGGERGIAQLAEVLGRGPADYVVDSYRSLFVQYCTQRSLTRTDMLFDEP
jgi:adenylate cyclase class 2